jgi:hypothetical protein
MGSALRALPLSLQSRKQSTSRYSFKLLPLHGAPLPAPKPWPASLGASNSSGRTSAIVESAPARGKAKLGVGDFPDTRTRARARSSFDPYVVVSMGGGTSVMVQRAISFIRGFARPTSLPPAGIQQPSTYSPATASCLPGDC